GQRIAGQAVGGQNGNTALELCRRAGPRRDERMNIFPAPPFPGEIGGRGGHGGAPERPQWNKHTGQTGMPHGYRFRLSAYPQVATGIDHVIEDTVLFQSGAGAVHRVTLGDTAQVDQSRTQKPYLLASQKLDAAVAVLLERGLRRGRPWQVSPMDQLGCDRDIKGAVAGLRDDAGEGQDSPCFRRHPDRPPGGLTIKTRYVALRVVKTHLLV